MSARPAPRRAAALVAALAVSAALATPGTVPGAAAGAALPDLCVRRDGLARDGDRVAIVIENRGDAPSPATEVETWDRPPLTGPVGLSSPYPPLPNRRGVWILQDRAAPDTVALSLVIGTDPEFGPLGGELILGTPGVLDVAGPAGFVERAGDGRAVRWDAAGLPPDRTVRVRVPGAPGAPPQVELRLAPDDDPRVPVVQGNGPPVPAWTTRFALDALDRPRAWRTRAAVPPLAPGERVRVEVEAASGVLGEVFAIVDPDEAVLEVREGNNVASIRDDAGRRAQCALHLHSSFSEGEGSMDWQVDLAARSGYDLLWWTEHDWRIDCLDHLERHDFEIDDPDPVYVPRPRDGNAAGIESGDAASGEASLRLAVPAGGRGPAIARLLPKRRRLAYSLAADVELSLAVRGTDLGRGDVLVVTVELSEHRGGQRELVYLVAPPDAPPPPEDAPGAPVRHLPVALAGDAWTRVTLPLSRDAATAWPNGLDDSITGLEFRLRAGAAADGAGDGAEVRVDELLVTHRRCGDALRADQARWVEEYPNVAHAIGEEVSWLDPHLNRYGGAPGFLDYADMFEPTLVEEVVERVHRGRGIVSWCHPFGVSRRSGRKGIFGEAYRDSLLDVRFGGTDLLEVGFRDKALAPLEEYLDLWDRAGMRGIAITGVGVNDSHGKEWGGWENDFATWVEAPGDDPDAVRRALAAGRAVFGDPTVFRGTLALEADGARPGDEVSGGSPRTLSIAVRGAPPGAVLRLMADGVEARAWTLDGPDAERTHALAAGEARVVRAELRGADGAPLAFGNPIRFRPVD